MTDAAVDPRFPVGRFRPELSLDEVRRGELVDAIRRFPEELDLVLRDLSAEALDRPYRDGGWTIRQLVHHLADSHMNAYIRFRLGLTEEHPTIRPYEQDAWAGLPDASRDPLTPSVRILEGVHARWSSLLRATPAEAFHRTIRHPESGDMTLDTLLQLYVWHGRHHLEHIRRAEFPTA